MIRFVTTAAAILFACTSKASADTILYIDDEAGWTAAAGGPANVRFFETTAANLAQADEVSTPPSDGDNLPQTLTFSSANTSILSDFAITSVDAANHRYVATFPVLGEVLRYNPANNDANSWRVDFGGVPVYSFAIKLIQSDDTDGESFSVFGASGLLASTTGIPDGTHNEIFLGVVSTTPITHVTYNESGIDLDNIGIADLQFNHTSPVPEPSSLALMFVAGMTVAFRFGVSKRQCKKEIAQAV